MERIINLEPLTDIVKEIEEIFNKHGLNILEKDLVIKEVIGRVVQEKRNQTSSDLMNNLDLKQLMRRFMNKGE